MTGKLERRFGYGVGVMLAGLLAVGSAPVLAEDAADYPSRTVEIVVPFAPGGPNDVLARMLSEHLAQEWNANVIVDNRPGGGTAIGTQYVVASEPDGYTLLMVSTSTASNVSLRPLPYDTRNDLVPIVQLGEAPTLLVVHPDSEIESVEDLIEMARERPGEMVAGSGGIGASTDLKARLLAQRADLDITIIPYEGEGPSQTDLLGGRLSWIFGNLLSTTPLVEAGELRAIAVSSAERHPNFPDVPTVGETIEGFAASNWWGIFGPAGLPEDVSRKINETVTRIVETDEVTGFMENLGTTPVSRTPEEFAAFFEEQVELWRDVIETAGIAER